MASTEATPISDSQAALQEVHASMYEFQQLLEDGLKRRKTSWYTIRVHADRGRIDKIQTLTDDMKVVGSSHRQDDQERD